MNSYRDSAGRYAKKGVKWGVAFVGFCAAIMLVGHFYVEPMIDQGIKEGKEKLGQLSKSLSFVRVAEAEEITPSKIEEMKGDVLDRLAECESPGNTEETLPVIEDNNSQGTLSRGEIVSSGEYRFKVGTVIGYQKMRTGQKLSALDAVQLALDKKKARDLASFIIFDTPKGDKGVKNWKHCAEKLDLETLVSFIKAHE